MSDELDENIQIFVSESEELLEEMETALLELEERQDDELLNQTFRAAHTIKGSAGLFGLEHIISFTHVVENVLDDMRNCIIPIASELITVLMRSKDHLGSLIAALPDEDIYDREEEQEILNLLNAFRPQEKNSLKIDLEQSLGAKEELQTQASTERQEANTGSDHYHISVRLGIDTFRQGFNPAAMFKQLENLGTIRNACVINSSLPMLSELDSENCYLGWEIAIASEASKEQFSEVFEFIEGISYTILPPKSRISDYRKLIQQLPDENDMALGQILIKTGSLTQEELYDVLQEQSEQASHETDLLGDLLVKNKVVQKEVVDEALQKQSKGKVKKQQSFSFVKVDSGKLDKLVNLVGELVINGAKMNQISERLGDDNLAETVETMMLSLEEMRETALGLRMIPIGSTFNRFHRVVRDISKELNKEIRLEIFGSETELDKTVIEKIADPLMHLVRNSLDHGIEAPEVRASVGKPREGLIQLRARHEAGMIVIQIDDDGQGMDCDKLLSKAIEKGIIKENQKLSKLETYNLIFEAGFSMAKEVSSLSGRGVGMDVVRRNIEALRGNIEINSDKGLGTTITIQLPLTLAIIDGFHINVAREDYIIPLDMIQECVTLTPAQLEEAAMHNYITLRQEVLPLIQLKKYFGLEGAKSESHQLKQKHENVVVVQFGNRKVGLIVDLLLGEIQAVIKPLGRVFKGLNGFAGFTILGSGLVALVIDVPGLIKDVVNNEKKQFHSWEKQREHQGEYYH